jgi:hypothetical protein
MSNTYGNKHLESNFASFNSIQEDDKTLVARFHRESFKENLEVSKYVLSSEANPEIIRGVFDIPLKSLYARVSHLEKLDVYPDETFRAINTADNIQNILNKGGLSSGRFNANDFYTGSDEYCFEQD